jgi:hypothetical protein
MKAFFCTILVLVLFVSITKVYGQDQEAWKNYMTPGPVHQMMAESVGDWDSQLTMWMDSSQGPQTFDVSCTNEMILGGRYLRMVAKGSMMNMPFEGMMLLGFDNMKKEYTSVWYDNMGTGTTIGTGRYNEADSTLTLSGTMVDPSSGNDIKYRETLKFVDKDKQIMDMYLQADGREFKNMEQVFTRKK